MLGSPCSLVWSDNRPCGTCWMAFSTLCEVYKVEVVGCETDGCGMKVCDGHNTSCQLKN